MLNSSSNLYKAEWIELVFQNRNKTYGAYLLRTESSSITLKALFMVVPVFVLLFAGPMIYKHIYPDELQTVRETGPVIIAPPPIEVKIEENKKEFPKAEPEKEKLKMVKLVSQVSVVERPKVEEAMPTLEELKDALVGQHTQDGLATSSTVTPVVSAGTENGTGTVTVDDHVYEGKSIERYPEFAGGMAAWAKFIQRNLRYPYMAQERETQGKVIVSFIVEKDGSISNVSVLKGIGDGCDEEAVRVISKSPRWIPGLQNKQNVRVRYTMPLSFQLGL